MTCLFDIKKVMNTIQLLKSKIHRATVTKADLNYDGSITIPQKILIKSKIREYEKVLVVNISNGQRFETYAITGHHDREICLNGAAARLGVVGDKIIIMAFTFVDDNSPEEYKPYIVFVDDNNDEITNTKKVDE